MTSLTITIIVIFVTAFVVAYLKATWRDRCLKDLEGFPVIISLKDGKTVWGTMNLESTGMLLRYSRPHKSGSHFETGFIIYKNEYAGVKAIYRILSDLDDAQRKKREMKTLLSRSGFFIAVRRMIRNFFAAVRDGVVESMKLLIGQVTPKSSVLSGKDKYVSRMGESFVDYIGNSYDPLLEKLIGRRVVYERFEEGSWREHTGILQNYTKDFLEIINTSTPVHITLSPRRSKNIHLGIEIERKDDSVVVMNHRQTSIKILSSDEEHILEPGQKKAINVSENITIELNEEIDVVFPRSEVIVRHTVD
ncbi:hypothetical protein [Kosmotoga pacifica]|uniref:Uncharacterized protein n=1 Tax=Kosmotoga pacifica TaxID=1330330 RepID=A0A0G2ZDD2_9BACT|nr:hypothetical protein [Kosmotoga pacifica]AKI96823.1 hypothetical protein IX53_02180 [Kosmotoga pacifica]